MTSTIVAFLRVLAAVLLAGYALFQWRMARSLGRVCTDPGERQRGWAGLRDARWPPGLPVAVSLGALGWILLAGLAVLALGPDLFGRRGPVGAEALLLGAALAAHAIVVRTAGVASRALFMVLVLGAAFVGVAPRPGFDRYTLALGIHVLAAALWLGHMFFWSLVSGPALKRLDDRDLGGRLRALSLEGGGLGWPALAVLFVTGWYLLWRRGLVPADLVSGALLGQRFGVALDAKLLLVLLMVLYQAVFGHREAPRAIYADMLAAIAVLALAVVLTGV